MLSFFSRKNKKAQEETKPENNLPVPLSKYKGVIGSLDKMQTLMDTLNNRKATHEFTAAIARIYGKGEDTSFLHEIMWAPQAIPAPVLGFQLRQGRWANAAINAYGFRDTREAYTDKPAGTFRIFLTGGSVSFGSGAPSQEETIAGHMERLLNEEVAPRTGRRYEVVNAGLPAGTSLHEQLLVQTRIARLQPDRVVMFSGHNDIYYARALVDPNWRWPYAVHNYMLVLNELYQDTGFNLGCPLHYKTHRRMGEAELAEVVFRNVMITTLAAGMAGAGLVFALQPDIWSTPKPLSPRERAVFEQLDADERAYWTGCQDAMRRRLPQSPFNGGPGYAFLDLSRLFDDRREDEEVFIDSCHFAGTGNAVIARALIERMAWP